MAITEAEGPARLAVVRRLEAAGFRAFPAGSTAYDGTWAIRLTKNFASKRLNSVNPLDPSDHSDLAARISRAAERFAAIGRPLVVRQSPLASPALVAHLDREGWRDFGDSMVMTAELETLELGGAVERIPLRDPARYVAASLAVHGRSEDQRAGMLDILAATEPPVGMFVQEAGRGEPVAVALAVHDNDLAGLLDVSVAGAFRRRGIARDLVRTALHYTCMKGARTAWLQVEADNAGAIALYHGLGFREAYRYSYRTPPVQA